MTKIKSKTADFSEYHSDSEQGSCVHQHLIEKVTTVCVGQSGKAFTAKNSKQTQPYGNIFPSRFSLKQKGHTHIENGDFRTDLTDILHNENSEFRTDLTDILHNENGDFRTELTDISHNENDDFRTDLTEILHNENGKLRTDFTEILHNENGDFRTNLTEIFPSKLTKIARCLHSPRCIHKTSKQNSSC